MAFYLLVVVVFFFLGIGLLLLPWHGAMLLAERMAGGARPADRRYATLLIAPILLSACFVLAILGPWDAEICHALHHTCLERVADWQVPVQLGLILAVAGVLAGGRLLRPYLRSLGSPMPRRDVPTAQAAKWAAAVDEVLRRTGQRVPAVSAVAHPDHRCGLTWLGRPRLVVSAALLQALDHDELVAAIAHELAHLRRGDLGVGAIAYACYCLLFFMPLGRRCYQRYLEERELAADDWAIARTGDAPALASALAKTWRLATEAQPGHPRGGALLRRRCWRLMGDARAWTSVGPWERAGALAMGLAGASGAMVLMSFHLTLESWGWNLMALLRIIA